MMAAYDLDGTLIDSVDVHARSYGVVLERHGYPAPDPEKARGLIGKRGVEIFLALVPGLDRETAERLNRERKRWVMEHADEIGVYWNRVELLKWMRERGVKVALVTSSSRYFAEEMVKRLGLGRIFDCVVTADDVERGKPDPEPFLKAKECLGEEEGIGVGDTEYDKVSAEGAGLRFFWAWETKEIRNYLLGRLER